MLLNNEEELLKRIEELEGKLNETENKLQEIESKPKKKTSQAQIKASNKYLKEHPEVLKASQKRYYVKKSQDPVWMAEQSRTRCERYHKQKNELKKIEKDKELINYLN